MHFTGIELMEMKGGSLPSSKNILFSGVLTPRLGAAGPQTLLIFKDKLLFKKNPTPGGLWVGWLFVIKLKVDILITYQIKKNMLSCACNLKSWLKQSLSWVGLL